MWVRILQGKQTGLVTEVCQSEGENLLTTGFAARVDPPVVAGSPALGIREPVTREEIMSDAPVPPGPTPTEPTPGVPGGPSPDNPDGPTLPAPSQPGGPQPGGGDQPV